MASVPPGELLAALRRAVGADDASPEDRAIPAPGPGAGPPPGLAGRPAVDLDVREDIRRGIEPFARIMTAVKGLHGEEVLVLRAPFEPIPLYDVLGRRGFAHWTERRSSDDWAVWFYREPTSADRGGPADLQASATTSPGDMVDVRGLEPPLPMVRILERLDALGPGQALLVIHERRPMLLYPQLDERGFVHETRETEPGRVEILIRRDPGSAATRG
jgi:uncharacterized protein (DUF2249 family)